MATPSVAPGIAPGTRTVDPLTRPRECLVSGVSAGLAGHLGRPVALVRTLFIVATAAAGAGALLYAWLWAFTPWEPSADAAPRIPHRRVPIAWLLLALAGLAVLVAIIADRAFIRTDVPAPPWLAPTFAAALLAVAASTWATFIDRADPLRGPRLEQAVRFAAAAMLGVLIIALLVSPVWGGLRVVLVGVLPVLIAIGLVFAPSLVRQWRELSAERTRLIREEQRAEIAAHLHDSVLQTLALIQNRAGASSEVARIARAQERELRSWLFEADAPADSDLGTDLRDFAAGLELDYPVRVDVVAVGSSTERASGELAAAAREAMLNAARHAGGDVSVYVEGAADGVDVFVRDRGPGFDPTGVPGDRIGVRESIIGRMRRIGGNATVAAGAGGVGTEVHLRFEAPAPAPGVGEGGRG
jgi:signal transduction histidine kinase